MDKVSLLNNEKIKHKQFSKRAGMAVSLCLIGCSLLLLLQLICAMFFPSFEDEIAMLLSNMIMYVIYIVIPFGFVDFLFKKFLRSENAHTVKRESPKNPLLYIFGTIGIGYLVNMIISLVFSEFVEKFSVDSSFVPKSMLGVVLFYILYAVMPAFLEEWAFRKVILKNLLPYGRYGAIIISALLFGIVHIDPPRIIFATMLGLLLGICYERTGSIRIPIIIHFINNAISVTATVAFENMLITVFVAIFIYACIACGIVGLFYYYKKGLGHKKASIDKPSIIGFKLSSGKFLVRFPLNYAVIPFIMLYAVFFYLYYLA